MKDEDIQNLLGGFATDSLTDQEREALFTAALHNQKLFDALADEEVLRELLSDPASRRQVLEALQPAKRGAFEWLTGWMRRPLVWAVAGSAIAALVVAIAIRQPRPQPAAQQTETARLEPRPAEIAAPVLNPEPEPRRARQAPPRTLPGGAAREIAPAPPVPPPPAPASVPPATVANHPGPPEQPSPAPAVPPPSPPPPPAKMKVAVLDFDSGQTEAGKEASERLGKKLDTSQFTVMDRKKVEEALQSQNLVSRDLDASGAASFGRSVGADAVIVGSVKAAAPSADSARGGALGRFRSMSPLSSNKAGGAAGAAVVAPRQLEVTATAINTKTSGSLAKARAPAQGGLVSAVDSVASSLNQQLQQNVGAKISGLVTNVAESVLTLNVGAKEGLKVGDRLQVRRDGKAVGVATITSVRDEESQGTFQGDGVAQTGDGVVSPVAPDSVDSDVRWLESLLSGTRKRIQRICGNTTSDSRRQALIFDDPLSITVSDPDHAISEERFVIIGISSE